MSNHKDLPIFHYRFPKHKERPQADAPWAFQTWCAKEADRILVSPRLNSFPMGELLMSQIRPGNINL